jgi:pre-mRNA-splicing factor CWC22
LLDVFKLDTEYTANEEKYATLRKEILDESENDASGEDEEGSDEEEEGQEEDPEKAATILDKTETNLVSYLIQMLLI